MKGGRWASVLCAVTIALVGLPKATTICIGNSEYYELYHTLELALMYKPNNTFNTNFQKLIDAFFPKQSPEPLCVGVEYVFPCSEGKDVFKCYDEDGALTNCAVCNFKCLWTKSNVGVRVGALLLAYHRGISVKGFEWDRSCLVNSSTEIRLQDLKLLSYNSTMLEQCLTDLTTQLKGFAAKQRIPDVDSSHKGYSIDWSNSQEDIDEYDAVFTSQVVVISIFIFLFSLSTSNVLYGKLFQNIYDTKNLHSINPAYPIYWAIVVVSVLWNVAPSWIVVHHSRKILYAIAVLIPLQLLVAISVKKRNDFPIPFFRMLGCIFHVKDGHSCVPRLCIRCFARHAVQVCAIWSLLVTYAFLMHYMSVIIIAFYLDPLGTIAKLLFVKAVGYSLVLNIAVLFTIDKPTYICNRSSLMKWGRIILSTLTILSFLPILGYLTYVVGQIVFVDYSGGSWQSVLTVIPPLILAVTSWYSQGLLFPDGIKDPTHPIKEIEHDLEGNNSHSDDSGSAGGASSTKVLLDATPLFSRGGRQSLNLASATAAGADSHNGGGGVAQRNRYHSVPSSLSESGGKLS